MDSTRKIYVRFYYPGALVGESTAKRVKSRDASKVRVPQHAYGFRFFEVLETTVEINGQSVKMRSAPINESPMHYYGGRVYTRAEIVREVPDHASLLANMEAHSWERMIKTRVGYFLPFEETDILIEPAV